MCVFQCKLIIVERKREKINLPYFVCFQKPFGRNILRCARPVAGLLSKHLHRGQTNRQLYFLYLHITLLSIHFEYIDYNIYLNIHITELENMFLCIFVVLMQPKYTYGHEYIENWLYANVLKHWNYSSSPAIIILCVYIRHCQLHDVGTKVRWCYIIIRNDIIKYL